MCAMIPMFRVFSRGNSRAIATSLVSLLRKQATGPFGPVGSRGYARSASTRGQRFDALPYVPALITMFLIVPPERIPSSSAELPAVMRKRPVGFRHLLEVFPPLDRRPDTVAGVEELAGQPLRHSLLPALAGVTHDPT